MFIMPVIASSWASFRLLVGDAMLLSHLCEWHLTQQLLHGFSTMARTPGQVGSSHMPGGGVGHQAVGIR